MTRVTGTGLAVPLRNIHTLFMTIAISVLVGELKEARCVSMAQ